MNGSCVATPARVCTRDVECPQDAICEGGVCVSSVYVQPPPPPVYVPPSPLEPAYVSPFADIPGSVPWILQVNLGFGAMFSGLGAGLEFGYAGEYIGGTGFFNLGFGLDVASGSSFGYGGGARFLAGHNPHFGYLGIAYTLVATATASPGWPLPSGPSTTEDIWGPSFLFGYQYTSAVFRVFADIGFSWVSDPWDGMYIEGSDTSVLDSAVFTFDLGIGFDCLGWEVDPAVE
jgi:hypothetical protein